MLNSALFIRNRPAEPCATGAWRRGALLDE
jgi:hypothetical protein